MDDSRYLLDSNILIRWVQRTDADYTLVASALDLLSKGGTALCYTSQNLAEFWNACTRPAVRNGFGLTPQETDRRARFIEANLQLLPDSLAVHQEWRKLLVLHAVSGVQVYDARLVAAMRIHGVRRILTFNDRDFVRYTDIEAVHPRVLVTTP
jgi:predicted nucleic acid-binding protein